MKESKVIYKKVRKHLLNNFGKEYADYILETLGTGSGFIDTICLLPYWFFDSFKINKYSKNIHPLLLGEYNLKAWIGYTLYDYIRDDKISKDKLVKTISIANICIHEALFGFISEADSKNKKEVILNLCNKIDLFYVKEHKYNTFKSIYSHTYEKSLAACISALLVIPESHYDKNIKNILNFFKGYYTARQLSDDLDDFKKDIKLKIITPVTCLIKEGLSDKELNSKVKSLIRQNINSAIRNIKKVENFDYNYFISKYVKDC